MPESHCREFIDRVADSDDPEERIRAAEIYLIVAPRPGSETNRLRLKELGIRFQHADLRQASDLTDLPGVDWVIDAAANPSVLAGVDGKSSTRQLYEHNLLGSLNILEYCRAKGAGLLLISSSRVYSTTALAAKKR